MLKNLQIHGRKRLGGAPYAGDQPIDVDLVPGIGSPRVKLSCYQYGGTSVLKSSHSSILLVAHLNIPIS